jgi:hypothetical protein
VALSVRRWFENAELLRIDVRFVSGCARLTAALRGRTDFLLRRFHLAEVL